MKIKFIFKATGAEITVEGNPFAKLKQLIEKAVKEDKKLKAMTIKGIYLGDKPLDQKKGLMELGIKTDCDITIDGEIDANAPPDPFDIPGISDQKDTNSIFLVVEVTDKDQESKTYSSPNGEVVHTDDKTTKANINSDIYFLCDKGISKFEKSYDLLNADNADLFIDGEQVPFAKSHKFDKPGKHIVKYALKTQLDNLDYMFAYCIHIVHLDFSHFDASKVKTIVGLVLGCMNLVSLNFDKFLLPSVKEMKYIFNECYSLTQLKCSKENNKKLAMIYALMADKLKVELTD